jgi:UDP-GlcNAc3NAcA epimerase
VNAESKVWEEQLTIVNWVSIVGARPQFIKLAPLCRAIRAHNEAGSDPYIKHQIVHTGQHYDPEMVDLLFVQLGIPEPTHNLEVGSDSHGKQLARMIERLEPILAKEKPDWAVVYGDTNSTLAAAIVAARMGVPLAHVEAGCRSHNRRMSEEQNRVLADHLSQLLLAPSQSAFDNLCREGIGTPSDPQGRSVTLVGDIMYDALLDNLPLAESHAGQVLEKLGCDPGKYYLLTLHRAENTDDPRRLQDILDTVEILDMPVLFPLHPRTRRVLSDANIRLANGRIKIVLPLGYFEMLVAEKNARKILTDSGGVQKEAFYLRVPCVTLREETEWPETALGAANRIVGTDRNSILDAVHEPMPDFNIIGSPFGNGSASQHVLRELLRSISDATAAAYADPRETGAAQSGPLADARFQTA